MQNESCHTFWKSHVSFLKISCDTFRMSDISSYINTYVNINIYVYMYTYMYSYVWHVLYFMSPVEWDVSHVWMSHVTNVFINHVANVDEKSTSTPTCEMSRVTRMRESSHTYGYIMSHIWIYHVIQVDWDGHVHRKSSLYLPLGLVKLILQLMGTPDGISTRSGWNRVSRWWCRVSPGI